MLAPIVVNSWLDNGDGDKITLREAIETANTNLVVHDTITFDPAVFNTPRTINLLASAGGQLTITQSLTIDGTVNGVSLGITIVAATNNRILNITGGNVTLDSLTLTGGNTSGEGGAIRANNASLTVQHSTITGNTAAERGGGIAFFGDSAELRVISSIVSGNTGRLLGGGIAASVINASVYINGSTIDNNQSCAIWTLAV